MSTINQFPSDDNSDFLRSAGVENSPVYLRNNETGELLYHQALDSALKRLERSFDYDEVVPVVPHRPQRFSEDGAPRPGAAASARQMAVLEFQGNVVKLQLRQKSYGGDIGADEDFYRRGFERAFEELARALPEQAKFRDELGRVVAADLSPALLQQLELDANKEARALYEVRIKSRRGAIEGFSRRARKRLLEWVSRLDAAAHGLFVTVTYRKQMGDHVAAKNHLDKLRRWLQYHYPDCAIIWRMEYQERGAIHFHLLVFNVDFIPAKKITRYWQRLTGDDSYPDLARIENRRKAAYYVSKYIAKAPPKAAGFISLPYSENTPQPASFIGRFWGICSREKLPLAPLVRIVHAGAASVIMDFRRLMRRYTADRMRWRSKVQGFTCFVDNSERWRVAFNALC